MADLREVELRIAVAEGVVTSSEADALGEEARRKQRSPLALLVERGRLSEDSRRSLVAEARKHAEGRTASQHASGSTHTMLVPPADADERAFPVAAWDRYTNVRFLGRGGMGKVFLAIDTRLRREVAIKFVRGDGGDHVQRLIAEARTQARVKHERICGVYEVGEVEGKVYIAMQYIAGEPLGSLAGELTVEQKVMLVRGAAEGIHEAHREGIIHRDIKPSNIMVERSDNGELKPYVMDFGLARSAQDAGVTQTGAVMGTPRYMAPEQARGSTAKLDRRADIYSLGATLYHLVTGEPPIPGDTVAEVIHNLMTLEPRPLRAIDPDIPIDLEAIVLKCLEKDRTARYDSARALADDLGRFMNGDPVLARPAGRWYRLRKRIAKHRRLVIAGALVVAVIVGLASWLVKTRLDSTEQNDLTRRFTERVERIEALARYSALSPLHDITADRATIRARMTELSAEIAEAGELGEGPGHYALGRGHLALDDDAKALDELTSAWASGFREPRVAYALALALGHLYQQGLLAAERIEQEAAREARKRDIEQRYRKPALAYLEASGGAEVPSPRYTDALVAYYEGHLDEALRQLDAIGDGLPWFYEAPELRGDILLARALGFRHTGQNERARSDFEAGRKAYAAAAALGESVPAVYESLGELECGAMAMELYSHGDVMPPFRRALASAKNVLAVVPDHYDALVLEARAQRILAEHRARQGSNVEDLLTGALASAERAVKVAPQRPQARLTMAQIYRQWAEFRSGHRDDPTEQFRKAVEASDAISPDDHDDAYYRNRGLIFQLWAEYDDQNSADGEAHRKQAIDAYEKALAISPRMVEVRINLGIYWFKRASLPNAQDPDGDLHQAIDQLDKAKMINPEYDATYFYEGEAYELMAQRERAKGQDPTRDLNNALDVYQRGLAFTATKALFHNGIGIVYQDQANAAWDRGEDPGPPLDRAKAAFEDAIAVAPDQGYGYDNVGEVLVQRAWFQRARGEDPSASVVAAVNMLNQAIRRIPNHATFWADLGMAYAVQAGYELEHGRDPRRSLDQASAAIDTALSKNPGDPQAQVYLGETRGIRARYRARQGMGQPADFAAAAEAFQKAVELAPANQEYPVSFGHFCRAWAMFQHDPGADPVGPLMRGLALANRVMDRRPGYPDALVLRASLHLLKAQGASGALARHDEAREAESDFAAALASNPALENVWGGQRTMARQLAAR